MLSAIHPGYCFAMSVLIHVRKIPEFILSLYQHFRRYKQIKSQLFIIITTNSLITTSNVSMKIAILYNIIPIHCPIINCH